MKVRTKIEGWKDVLAWSLNGIVIGLILWGFISIPIPFWVACWKGIAVAAYHTWQFLIVLAIALGYILWFMAIVGGAISLIGLAIPTIHYILKWFHWAIMYTWFSDKKEPRFPPVWSLKGTWKPIGKGLEDSIEFIIALSVIAIFIGCIIAMAVGHVVGLIGIAVMVFMVAIIWAMAGDI